jgi:predicted transposase/invertase (TIGR01784 family)
MTCLRYISPEINNSNVKHFREGKEEGLREGLEKGILQVAKKMKAAGVDEAVILATTGLNEDDLNSL